MGAMFLEQFIRFPDYPSFLASIKGKTFNELTGDEHMEIDAWKRLAEAEKKAATVAPIASGTGWPKKFPEYTPQHGEEEPEPWEPPEEDEPGPDVADLVENKVAAAKQAATVLGKRKYTKRDHVQILESNIEYLNIRSRHHRNPSFSWAVVAILSELDFFMNNSGVACFSSTRHLAAVARVTMGTARNLLRDLTANGIIIPLGYHERSRERIVAPEYSDYPELSRSILKIYVSK